jgi:ATP-binding cassette subfamily E protein 1
MRKFKGTVRELLEARIGHTLGDRTFRLIVSSQLIPSQVLLDKPVASLSGGELQRVAITICLGTPARIYLLDEPAAGLDCEQRLAVAKAVRRWVCRGADYGQTVLVIEHDLLMLSAMAERVVLFSGEPSVNCQASTPGGVIKGLNKLLGSN